MIFLVLLMTSLSFAQPVKSGGAPPKKNFFSVGIFGWVRGEEYGGEGNRVRALPLINFQYKRLSLLGPNLNYKAFNLGPIAVSASVGYDGSGYDSGDTSRVEGMKERKGTVLVGVNMKTKMFFPWEVSLSASQDILNRHASQLGQVTLSYSKFFMPKFIVKPSIQLEVLPGAYMDYYYGVEASEATNMRPAYDSSSALRPSISTMVIYLHSKSLSFLFKPEWTFFPKEIKNSPLMDKSSLWKFALGLTYRF